MNKEFKEAVASNNLEYVRMMLSNELILDPRGSSFAKMLEYAKDKLPNLFEEEVPSDFEIPVDKELWNDDLLSKMKRALNINFSVEKLALYVEMAKHLGASKAEEMEQEERMHQEQILNREKKEHERSKEQRSNQDRTHVKTGRIVTGSGIVIEIIGLCLKSSLLSIVGGVAIVAGVTLLVASKKK